MDIKPGRNDLCWCGSGRKYKKCHLNRSSEERLPFEAIRAKTFRASAYKTCLHPAASNDRCGKIVSAHTIQRARVLKEIADSQHHVLTFYPSQLDTKEGLKLHRTGWQRASTFSAFCDIHDTKAFSPLEQNTFSASKEQIFLIAYRAFCWELYRKKCATRAGSVIRDLIDRGAPEERQLKAQNILQVQQAGFNKGLENLYRNKEVLDHAFLTKDYTRFKAIEFLVDGPMSIASTGAITPNHSLDGTILQTLHDDNEELQWLAFGVDISDRGCSVVFFWLEKDKAPSHYIDSMLSLGNEELASFLVQFFFVHCENTYFSIAWWEGLSSNGQDFIKRLAANTNPYYYLPKYNFDISISPWKIINSRVI